MTRFRFHHIARNLQQSSLRLQFGSVLNTSCGVKTFRSPGNTIFNEYCETVQPIITLHPPAEIIDVLRKWFMVAQGLKGSPKPFLNLSLELIQTHIVNGVLKSGMY